MPDVLVVQWARLGDLFHTRPLLARCRAESPDTRVWLSYDARYQNIVRHFPELDDQLPIDLENIVGNCRHDAALPDALATVVRNTARVAPFDSLYNVTNHPGAVYFSRIVPAARRLGYGFERDDTLTALMLPDARCDDNCTHIADVWKLLVEGRSPNAQPTLLEPRMSRFGGKRVVIVCDAGSRERDLDYELIRALVRQAVLANATDIALVGARPPDAPIELTRDLRGQTNLTELYSVISSATHVIGPDTGALHFGAALGRHVFGIYLDDADPRRTGPYSTDAWCVKGDLLDQSFRAHVVENASRWMIGSHFVPGTPHEVFLPEWRDDRLLYTARGARSVSAHAGDKLSIIIVEHQQVHYADDLLAGIERDLDLCCEIIVVSSGLDKTDARHALARRGVKALVSKTPLSFAQANNWGAQRATGDWCLFLNDDCKANPRDLRELFAARDDASILAPTLRYWDGTLQSKGVTIDESGVHEIDTEITKRTLHRVPQAVSGAAMLVKKNAFQALGGFDTAFVNGYEDVDFCMRAAARGISCKVAEQELVHYRSSSPKRFLHDDHNLALLRQRWSSLFMAQRGGETREVTRTPILLVSDEPAHSAGPVVRWLSPLSRCGLRQHIDFEWMEANDNSLPTLSAALEAAKAVIIFRSLSNSEGRAMLRGWQERRSGPFVHDADDLLIGRFPPSSQRATMRREFELGVRELMSWATFCTATSDELLRAHAIEHDRRHVLSSIPLPDQFASRKQLSRGKQFRIGYAGGRAHLTDLAMIEPALVTFLEQQADARFYWWGAHPGELAGHPGVRRGGPWLPDYHAHLKRIQNVPIDLWLVPLADAPHNSVRSPIKAFEYLGMGATALFSAVEPYLSLLRNTNGTQIVNNTTPEWVDALQKAYNCWQTAPSRCENNHVREPLQALADKLEQYHSLLHKLDLNVLRDLFVSTECKR